MTPETDTRQTVVDTDIQALEAEGHKLATVLLAAGYEPFKVRAMCKAIYVGHMKAGYRSDECRRESRATLSTGLVLFRPYYVRLAGAFEAIEKYEAEQT